MLSRKITRLEWCIELVAKMWPRTEMYCWSTELLVPSSYCIVYGGLKAFSILVNSVHALLCIQLVNDINVDRNMYRGGLVFG